MRRGAAAHPAEVGSWDRYPGTSSPPGQRPPGRGTYWEGRGFGPGGRRAGPVPGPSRDGGLRRTGLRLSQRRDPAPRPREQLQPDPVLRRGKPWISKKPTCRDAVRKEPPPPAASRAPQTTPPGGRGQDAPPMCGRGCLKAKALAGRES